MKSSGPMKRFIPILPTAAVLSARSITLSDSQAVCPNATKPLGAFCYSVLLKAGVLCYNILDILCTEEVRKERD